MAVVKYDESLDLIRGEELLVYIKDNADKVMPIAFASTHTLSISADTIDTSNKMSGRWKAAISGQVGWQITADALLSKVDGHLSFKTLAKMAAKGAPVEVHIANSKSPILETDDEFAMDETKKWFSGTAFITSIDKKADKGAICSSSITLQGTGAIKDSAGVDLDK